MTRCRLIFVLSVLGIQSYALFGQDSIIVKTEPFSIKCFNLKENGKGVIKSGKELETVTFLTDPRYFTVCDDVKLPDIDFSASNLIWIEEGIAGCKPPEFSYKLIKIPSQKVYYFILTIKQNGTCQMLNHVHICELVPKFEEGYAFRYEIKKE
jgi:hypothetical protein